MIDELRALVRVLGPTHYHWTPEVQRVVDRIEREFPGLKCNTYVGHPFPGWGQVSLDVWDLRGRGWPLSHRQGRRVLQFALNLELSPPLRHWIFEHTIWTSWGGESYWAADDHSGRLRHVHLTYWK